MMDDIDERLFSDSGTPPPPPPPPSPPTITEDIFPPEYVASVNDLEDALDKMMLTIFETMRSDPNAMTSDDKAQEIVQFYYETLYRVDHLVGINQTATEIEEGMITLSEQYQQTTTNIFKLEDEIKVIRDKAKEKLNQVSLNLSFHLSFRCFMLFDRNYLMTSLV